MDKLTIIVSRPDGESPTGFVGVEMQDQDVRKNDVESLFTDWPLWALQAVSDGVKSAIEKTR